MAVYRSATAADGEAVIRLLSRAYGREEGSSKLDRDRAAFLAHPGDYRVLERDGEIVSALHIGRHRIQVGCCVVTKADVGHVATLPEYQGQGYATRLMEETVSWMRQEGFHLSRLGGYARFYRRFGWVQFLRGFLEFPLSGLRSRGGFVDPEEVLQPAYSGRIRPYDPVVDAEVYARLYRAFNHNRTGAQSLDFPPSPGRSPGRPLDPWRVVYEASGEVLAFLFAATAPTDRSRFETRVTIQNAGVSPDAPTPLGYLLRHILLAAHRRGAQSVVARLPLDPALYPTYRGHTLGYIPTLYQATESSNMLQVIDFPGLIDTILPELQTRLQDAAVPIREGGLRLRVNGQAADLCLRDGQLTRESADLPELELPQDLFCFLLLGLQPVHHVVRQLPHPPTRAQIAFLSALFPPQPTATGVWG